MKFYSATSFLEHLGAAANTNAASLWLICHDEAQERGYILNRIKDFFLHHEVKLFSIKQGQGQLAIDELLSFDLFAEKSLVVVEEVDKWDKKGLEALAGAFEALGESSPVEIVLVASQAKGIEPFYKAHDAHCVCLDLSKEKPWDKDKRLAIWCQEIAKRQGKTLYLEVANRILERARGDLGLVESELKAVVDLIGDRAVITMQDVQKTGSALPVELSWDFAKKLVYEEAIGASRVFHRGVADNSFASQVRYFLHIGLALCSKGSTKTTSSVMMAINKFSDQKKRNFMQMAQRRGRPFFDKGLKLLAQTEQLIRLGGKEKALLETFCIQLEKEKLRG